MPTRRAADASPTCHRRVSDASPSHRQRLALDAALFCLSSKSSHPKRLVERRRRRVADSATRRRRRSMRRQRPALHAPLLDLSSTSYPHLVIQPTRRIERQRNAGVSLTCHKRVADALTTRRVADAKPTRRGGDESLTQRQRNALLTTHRRRIANGSPKPFSRSATYVAPVAVLALCLPACCHKLYILNRCAESHNV